MESININNMIKQEHLNSRQHQISTLKQKLETGLYDHDNKLNTEMCDTLWKLIVLDNTTSIESENNIIRGLKVLEGNNQKLKNINQL